MKKQHMSIWGIGLKLTAVGAAIIIPASIVYVFSPNLFAFLPSWQGFRIIGIVLCFFGLAVHIVSARMILKHVPDGTLMQHGVFAYSRNPMYSAWIVCILPGLALVFNAWYFIAAALVVGIVFSRLIAEEEIALDAVFGEPYRNYRKRVGRIIPVVRFRKK